MWQFLLENSSIHNIIVFTVVMALFRFVVKSVVKLVVIGVVIAIVLYLLNHFGILTL